MNREANLASMLTLLTASFVLILGCSDSVIEERLKKKNQSSDAEASVNPREASDGQTVVRAEQTEEDHGLLKGLALVRAYSELSEEDLDSELILDEQEVETSLEQHWARIIIEFDANGNGRIDPGSERRALKAHIRELLKNNALEKFDTNGDGILDKEERAAMRDMLRNKLMERRAEHRGIRGLQQRGKRKEAFCKRIQEHAATLGEKLPERPILQGALRRCEILADETSEE